MPSVTFGPGRVAGGYGAGMGVDSHGEAVVRSQGPFQFLIKGVEGATPDGGVRVFGHHRAGVWLDQQAFELVCRDGVTHRLERVDLEPPLSEACASRGQRVLVLYGLRREQVHRNHWVRATSSVLSPACPGCGRPLKSGGLVLSRREGGGERACRGLWRCEQGHVWWRWADDPGQSLEECPHPGLFRR